MWGQLSGNCVFGLGEQRKRYVKLIGSGHGPMSYGVGANLRLNAEVRGMGPEFQLLVRVTFETFKLLS